MTALICSSSPPSNLLLLSHLFLHLIHCLVFLLPLLFLLNFLPSASPLTTLFLFTSSFFLPLLCCLHILLLPSSYSFYLSSSALYCPVLLFLLNFLSFSTWFSATFPSSTNFFFSTLFFTSSSSSFSSLSLSFSALSSCPFFCLLFLFSAQIQANCISPHLLKWSHAWSAFLSRSCHSVFNSTSSCWICFVVESCLTLRKLLFDQENNFNSDSLT